MIARIPRKTRKPEPGNQHPVTATTRQDDHASGGDFAWQPRAALIVKLSLLAVLMLLHAWQSVRLFPSMGALLDPDQPVLSVDHALHTYHGALGAGFLARHGTPWGLDPSFMAGYPESPLWDSSSNLSLLFQLPAGGKVAPLAYKLGLLGCGLVLMPALVWGAIAGVGLGFGAVVAGGVLAWLYVWVGFPVSLWISGLFSFITASALMVLLLGLLIGFDRRPSAALWLAITGLGAIAFWAHVTAPIVAFGGLCGFLLATVRKHRARWTLSLILAAALVASLNLVWLIPLWQLREIRTGSGFFLTSTSPWVLPLHLVFQPLDGRVSLLIIVLGAGGLLRWWVTGRGVAAATFGGAALFLMLLAGLGSLWGPTRILEPLRFRIPLVLALACPAGSLLADVASLISCRFRHRASAVLTTSALGLAVLAGLGFLIPDTARFIASSLVDPPKLVVGYRPEMLALVESIRERTDLSGRIMLEDQLRLFEATAPESTHWTPLLPALLAPEQRQFIGGLYHAAFIQHHKATSFGDFHLGGRILTDWSILDLSDYLDRYNVGWVIAWSPVTRFVFDRFPGASRIDEIPRFVTRGLIVPAAERQWQAIADRSGADLANRYLREGGQNYVVYKLDRPRTYFLAGGGELVSSGPNRLEFRNVSPGPDGAALLSLHWHKTWQTDPPCSLERVSMPGDPVDFVRIHLPSEVPSLVLENSYRPTAFPMAHPVPIPP